MKSAFGIWWSLCGWRWWRDAGAEVARRVAPISTMVDDRGVGILRLRLQRIEHIARWVPGSRCLDRALTLLECADAEHLPAQFCVGVLREGSGIRAHAWVQVGDVIIDPDPIAASRFVRLQAYPGGLEFDR
jgi:Transglutaminase-like superfamily